MLRSIVKETVTLLERLNLQTSGMEQVKAAAHEPEQAATELLSFYRARTSVQHPVDRAGSAADRGQPLAEETRLVAGDALRNVLIASPNYPRYDFGPRIDWLTNRGPHGDDEWIWQLHRHSSWYALAEAYRCTGEEQYARCYVKQFLGWLDQCPPGKNSPAWRTLEAGIRGFSWTCHLQNLLDAAAYTPAVLVRQLNAFYDHAVWLTNREFSANNWGLMEAEGAAFIAMTFPEFRGAAAWRASSFAHLNSQMQAQVRPDGHQQEQCLDYHAGCIRWFANTAEMAVANGMRKEFPEAYWKGLERMCGVLMALGFPDGGSPQFGDTHDAILWRPDLLKRAHFFKRADLTFAATGGRQGRAPAQTAFALPDSGFYSLRSGWDPQATLLVLKCGPDGGWHCQPDNGTFEIFAGGRRLMPDSGTYIYHGDAQAREDRAWFRQTRVHQTLTLNGRNTAYAPRLRLWKPGAELDVLVVENASYAGLIHRRAVLFVRKRFFVIVDEALGEDRGDLGLHFQLAPGAAAFDEAGCSARTGFAEGTNLLVQGMPQEGLKLAREEGRVSFSYGAYESRPAIRFELAKGAKPVRFVTLLVPYVGQAPKVGVELLGRHAPGAHTLELGVQVNGAHYRVGYTLRSGQPQPKSSPSVVCVRLRTGVSPYAHAAVGERRPPVPVIERDERILLEGRVPPRPRGRDVKGLFAPWTKRP